MADPLEEKEAVEGDTLCTLAIAAGFKNCDPLRKLAQNAAFKSGVLKPGDKVTLPPKDAGGEGVDVDNKGVFVINAREVGLRFIHGSPDLDFKDDLDLTVLNVSNHRTDRAGANRVQAFVQHTQRKFDKDAHADPDTFKVEVKDTRPTKKEPEVLLEALQPEYDAGGLLTGHKNFDGDSKDPKSQRAKRSLKVNCSKMNASLFRSGYLRLVVDEQDQKARKRQTLLTRDMVDEGDEKVEILDQKVRATYVLDDCPVADPDKCKVVTELDVCEESDQMRVKLAVHILRKITGADPVATEDQTRKACLRFIRQLYAQSWLSLKFVESFRIVPPPSNLLAVANGFGRKSLGGKKIRIRVRADDVHDQTVEITTVKDHLPIDTAKAIADAINAAFPGGEVKATPSENSPTVGQTIGSADVLVGDPLTQRIRLNVLTNGDTRHPVRVGRINSTTIPDFDGTNSHVGTLEERTLVKNYDTGADRVDLFIVGGLGSTALGEAFTPNASRAVARQPKPEMINSALVFANTVKKKDHFHTTIPHEVGHILMDANHALTATEMMGSGSPVGANERVVHGPKRISDPDAPANHIRFDDPLRDNPTTRLRNQNAGLLDGW